MRLSVILLASAAVLISCGSSSVNSGEGDDATDVVAAEDGGPTDPAGNAGDSDPVVSGDTPAGGEGTSLDGGIVSAGGEILLAEGEFQLPAANAFGQPGFHQVLTATHTLPASLGPTAGKRLVIALRDANRTGATCATQHPLSGCATVDWSDAVSRPNVPATGVFDNSIVLQLSTGARRFFLSETLALARQPDRFDAG